MAPWISRERFVGRQSGKQSIPPRRRTRPLWFEQLEDRTMPALVSWDGGAGTLSWSDAANWGTDTLPTAADDVVIGPLGGGTIDHTAGATAIRSLHTDTGLDLAGGSLSISANSAANAPLIVSGGSLQLSNLTLGGTGSLTNGSQGTVTLLSATVNLAVENRGLLVSRSASAVNGPFANAAGGTVRVEGSGVQNHALLTVASGFDNRGAIELSSGASIFPTNATLAVGSGTLVNYGTIAALTRGNSFEGRSLQASLDNRGTLDVRNPLTLGGADRTFTNTVGTVSVQAGQTLTVSGSSALAGTGLTGFGTFGLAGNHAVSLPADLTVPPGLTVVLSGAVTMSGPGRLVNRGHFLVPPGSSASLSGGLVNEAGGTVRVESFGWHTNNDIHPAALTASAGLTNRGVVELSATGSTPAAATLTVTGGVLTNEAGGVVRSAGGGPGTRTLASALDNRGTVDAQADLSVGGIGLPLLNQTGTLLANPGRILDVQGGARFDGSHGLLSPSGVPIRIRGNLTGATTNADRFSPQGVVVFAGPGSAADPQLLEVMGADRGNTSDGYVRNFSYATLRLESTYVRLVDAADNAPGGGAEALYVGTLIVTAGSTLDLNGLKVYARAARIDGVVINGAITITPDPGRLALNTVTPGALSVAGEVDDWTFFGRAGDAVTVILDPGTAAPPPVAPVLGRGEVMLIAPDGTVLATVAGVADGQTVRLLGVPLPADGTYRVRVRAPADQPGRRGNYLISAWEARLDEHDLVFNQPARGLVETPYSVDRWSFSADANRLVRLDVRGVSSPYLRFKLTGPNGWVGFTDVYRTSDFVTLPAAGRYVLEVYSVGAGQGSYAFTLREVSSTALTLGVPHAGTLVGGGEAQLFTVQVTDGNPFQLTLDGGTDSDRLELYVKLGGSPTRQDFGFRSEATGADHSVLVPYAANGTWYVLLYADSAVASSPFTVRAVSSPLVLTGFSPDRLAVGRASVSVRGAGFLPGTRVELVEPAGATLPAAAVWVDSFTQLSAEFDLSGVAAGEYWVRVTLPGGPYQTFGRRLSVDPAGEPKLETRLILPWAVGRQNFATLWVEYANSGTAAMPAPILTLQSADPDGSDRPRLTLDQSILSQGLWGAVPPGGFSTSVQVYATGKTPGLLEPGERIQVPVFYAGLEQPWNTSDASVEFEVLMHEAGSAERLPWTSLKDPLRPSWLPADAWDAVFANLIAQVGPTWGDFHRVVTENFLYLNRLGSSVAGVAELFGFEVQQAVGLNPVSVMASAVDASLPTPGLPLQIGRSFGNTIAERYQTGSFGRGWSAPSNAFAAEETHVEIVMVPGSSLEVGGVPGSGTVISPPLIPMEVTVLDAVVVHESGGGQRRFILDQRTPGAFLSQPGDTGVLRRVTVTGPTTASWYELTESNGLVFRFFASGTLKGQLDTVKDGNGTRLTMGYTGGVLTSLTHSSGVSLALAYNAAGLLTSIADSVGRTTTYGYDASNTYLTSVTGPGGTTTYSYVTEGTAAQRHALRSVTDPSGVTRYFDYDGRGRLTATYLTGNADRAEYGYNETARVTVTDAAGVTANLFFNHLGRVARSEGGLGNYTRYEYDNAGRVVRETDTLGRSKSYTWCGCGSLTSVTDEYGRTTRFTPGGPLNQPLAFTDARGNAIRYTYDTAGGQTSATYADGSVERAAYDPSGNPTSLVNRRGQPVGLEYNAAGQVAKETYPDGSVITYTYDPAGRLKTATDRSGTTTFTYSPAGRLTRVDYPNARWLGYDYDAAGRRTRLEDSTGSVEQYRYDAAGRLERLLDGAGVVFVRYTYDPAGRLGREDKGNGTYTVYGYDEAGRTEQITHHRSDGSVNASFGYTFDALGRRTGMSTLDGVWAYTYDLTGQLTRAVFTSANPSIPDQDLSYEYDAVGNRVRTVVNGSTTSYATNALNQYTAAGASTYKYDLDGNMVEETNAAGTTRHTYDTRNRLVRVAGPQGTWEYEYDLFGSRTAVVENGVRTEYLVDPTGLGSVVAEFDGSGTQTTSYSYGIGLEAAVGTSGVRYYDFDALGSTAGISVTSGAYANRYAYDPFGEALQSEEGYNNQFTFVGALGVMTEVNGLHFMRARYYSSNFGRFLSEDPLGVSSDVNLYRYAGNNPVMHTDPAGLQFYGDYGYENGQQILWEMSEEINRSIETAIYETSCAIQTVVKHIATVSTFLSKITKDPVTKTILKMIITVNKIIETVEIFTQEKKCDPPPPPLPPPPPPPGAPGDSGSSLIRRPGDPNEKFGATGYGPQAYITGDGATPYRVHFENLGPGSDPTPPQPATAPAQRVVITDQLSSSLDWSTFQFTSAGFGDTVLSVPGDRLYHFAVVPMTLDGVRFDVEVELTFDPTTGQIRAVFQSVDPTTSLPPEVMTGFLPPEDGTGRGKGFISFLVNPKAGLPTGTEIRNVALIKFDGELVIATNQIEPLNPAAGTSPDREALNTIDAGAPTGAVNALPAVTSTAAFTITWAGQDDPLGSGVAHFDVYVSVGGGPFTLWLDDTAATSATYTGQDDRTYAFYAVATDNVGRRQAVPTAAQAVTTVRVNDAPVLAPVGNRTVDELQTLTFTASASDPDAGDGLTFSLVGAPAGAAIHPTSGVFTWTPAAAQGPAAYTFMIRVTDAAGLSDEETITVRVEDSDSPPTLDPVSDRTVIEDAGSQSVPLTGVTAGGTDTQPLIVSAVSSNPSLIPHPTVTNSSPATTGSLTFTPATNASGTAVITVTVSDGVTTMSRSFTVTVTPVNDAPSLTAGNPPAANEDAGPQSVANWTSFSPGPADEAGQAVLEYVVDQVSNPGLFAVLPTVSADGTLAYAPAPNASGTSTFRVRVRDNGGVADGGVDTSPGQTFTIALNPVNDAPVASTAGLTTDEDRAAEVDLRTLVRDVETAAADLTFAVGGAVNGVVELLADGHTARFTPSADYNGPAAFAYTVRDAGDNGTAPVAAGPVGVSVTVRPVNDAPTLEVGPVAITETAITFLAVGADVDVPETLTYALEGAPAGAAIDPATGALAWTPTAEQLGIYTFAVRVTDAGGLSAARPVTLTTLGVVGGELVYVGSAGADDVVFGPADSGGMAVTRNGVPVGTFAGVSRIAAHGLGGSDDLQVAGGLAVPSLLSGGAGDDRLKGGAGPGVLVGGAGDDLLVGGRGPNVLIGGRGADRIVGGAGSDLLISGSTAFNLRPDALWDILGYWSRSDLTYDQRVAGLRSGSDPSLGGARLDRSTVWDDGVEDVLTGSAGADWFLVQVDGDNGAVKDRVTDLKGSEFVDDLDFING